MLHFQTRKYSAEMILVPPSHRRVLVTADRQDCPRLVVLRESKDEIEPPFQPPNWPRWRRFSRGLTTLTPLSGRNWQDGCLSAKPEFR